MRLHSDGSAIASTSVGTIPRFKPPVSYLPLVFLVLSLSRLPGDGAVVVPDSNCYVINNDSRLIDYTNWIGHPFEYNGKDSDIVVRFCKDVESRSQSGYVDFGLYSPFNHFVAGSGPVDFLQEFYNGDLVKCEQSYDKMGRTAQVSIFCGNCLHGNCKGDLGCICDVTYDATSCRAFIELAIPCKKDGPRIFKGFTIGFHPRSWEIVYNGLTQRGFEKQHREFGFATEQKITFLYFTAISSLSDLVGKPSFKVKPNKGLDVKLSGSGANGNPPSTLSPTILIVDWRCEGALDSPYEVAISIPIKGYDPIEFTLTKICEYAQQKEGESMNGWATFGFLSCLFIIFSTLLCCGGLVYKINVEQKQGLDALPGITILSSCLETLSGFEGYRQAPDGIHGNPNYSSWEHPSASTGGVQATTPDMRYGSI